MFVFKREQNQRSSSNQMEYSTKVTLWILDFSQFSPRGLNMGQTLDGHHAQNERLYSSHLSNTSMLAVSGTQSMLCTAGVFCSFYQNVNTRGHHSMMCTLWMGWQVIDSMEMGRRGEEVGEGGEWGEVLEVCVLNVCETKAVIHWKKQSDVWWRWRLQRTQSFGPLRKMYCGNSVHTNPISTVTYTRELLLWVFKSCKK